MSYCEGNDSIEVTKKKKAKKRKHNSFDEFPSTEMHIKSEPDTDHSTHKKKSKLKHKFSMKLEMNGRDEESFLDVKVKEEDSKLKLLENCHSIKNETVISDSETKVKKSKKKKHNKLISDQSDTEVKEKVKHKNKDKRAKNKEKQLSQDEQSNMQSDVLGPGEPTSQVEYQSTEASFSEPPRKKKKKKHNKRPHEETKVFNNMEIDDHFSAEETVINTPRPRKESFKKKRLSEQIVFEDDDELNISNSQVSSKSDDVLPRTNSQSISEAETEIIPSLPITERDNERHSTDSLSSENEDEPRATIERSPVKDNSSLKKKLADYVSSLEECVVVECGEGVGDEGEGEEETWLVSAPRGLAAAAVRWVEVAGAQSRLKADTQRYVAALTHELPHVAVLSRHATLSHTTRVRCVRLQGTLRFHNKLPKRAPTHDLPHHLQTAAIPLPTTKTRHPLFGADYTTSILIPESVTQKLEDVRRKEKKSKKDKKVNGNVTPHEDIDEVDHVQVQKSKKKKKRKLSSEAATADSFQPKHKKKKKRTENSDVWHSEREMEETLFTF